MFCKNCGERFTQDQEFCPKCGIKSGQGNNYCPACKKRSAPNDKFCGNCGISLVNTPVIKKLPLGGKDKLLILFLCLFFGGFGVHNFVMGEKKKGFVKIGATILCCIVGYVLAIIDLVKIVIDTYDVDPDRFI